MRRVYQSRGLHFSSPQLRESVSGYPRSSRTVPARNADIRRNRQTTEVAAVAATVLNRTSALGLPISVRIA